MGLFDRIILTIYTFTFTFLSFLAIVASLGWLEPITYLSRVLQETNGRWTVGLLGSIFFVSSIRLLYFAFRRSRSNKTVIHQTEIGQVQVSLQAVENLVNRLVRQHKAVRDVRSIVRGEPEGIAISMRLWVSPEASIPALSDLLREDIGRGVQNVVGVEVISLDLDVENITTESRRSRVE